MDQIVQPLIAWYQLHKRDLPWRKERNAYYIWVSEIMLQQTRVEAVKGYFERFIQALPTMEDLAFVEEDILLKLWEGLGYYNRVRNMQKCALYCVAHYGGQLPQEYEQLLALPGIGSYTAGAIASIAYGIPKPAVDGNVLRVAARLRNDSTDIMLPICKKNVSELLEHIIPADQPGEFNQALMELGATICVPNGAPRCSICPVQSYCEGYRCHTAHFLPNKTAKKARSIEERTVLVVYCDQGVLLQKRPSEGLLSGLYEFINLEGKIKRSDIPRIVELQGMEILHIQKLSGSKHIFTHKEWHMQGYALLVYPGKGGIWAKREELDHVYSMPTAFKVYKEAALQLLALTQSGITRNSTD